MYVCTEVKMIIVAADVLDEVCTQLRSPSHLHHRGAKFCVLRVVEHSRFEVSLDLGVCTCGPANPK